MNLRDKLKFIESIPKVTENRPAKSPHKVNFSNYFDGEFQPTPFGKCFVITKTFRHDYRHGAVTLNAIENVDLELLALVGKDERLKSVQLEQTLFFDTETTGLSSGAGTYIFLAGFGYFAESGFVVKQFLLRDYNEELAFLYAINELFKQFTGLVSYNGKSFDWHLIESRFVFSRLEPALNKPPHLDLVHTARRIWRHRLTDCSLGNIERYVLDFFRHEDIPGFQIPSIYFQYLREKNVAPLLPIIRHNEWDILSLAALFIQSMFIYSDPQKFLTHHNDLASLAHSLENMNEWQRSIEIYKFLLANITDKQRTNHLAGRLGRCYKKLQKWENAVQMWEDMISAGYVEIEPYAELAKYYEHQQQDYQKAIDLVNNAISALDLAEELGKSLKLKQYKDELIHRRERNKRKLNARNMAE